MRIDSKKAAISMFLALTLAVSMAMFPVAFSDFPPAGTQIPSYSYVNVAPNPIGVGQTVTVNMFHAIPTFNSEGYVGMTVKVTDPNGNVETLGPFTSDTTGGTYTTYVPDEIGIWKFQMFYPGQTLTGDGMYLVGVAYGMVVNYFLPKAR